MPPLMHGDVIGSLHSHLDQGCGLEALFIFLGALGFAELTRGRRPSCELSPHSAVTMRRFIQFAFSRHSPPLRSASWGPALSAWCCAGGRPGVQMLHAP